MSPKTVAAAALIEGRAPIRAIGDRLILPLPAEASAQLPSRGQVAVVGTVDGHDLDIVLEPDGRKGHWIPLGRDLVDNLGKADGDDLAFRLSPAASWPEPEVPDDLRVALDAAPDLTGPWSDITPMARWEWVRWVGATKNPDTRARRVEVSIDKLRSGNRRPCCFDLSSCTDPEVSSSGKLLGIE